MGHHYHRRRLIHNELVFYIFGMRHLIIQPNAMKYNFTLKMKKTQSKANPKQTQFNLIKLLLRIVHFAYYHREVIDRNFFFSDIIIGKMHISCFLTSPTMCLDLFINAMEIDVLHSHAHSISLNASKNRNNHDLKRIEISLAHGNWTQQKQRQQHRPNRMYVQMSNCEVEAYWLLLLLLLFLICQYSAAQVQDSESFI